MGVYIKGMEMPKEGSWVSFRLFPDGQCFLYSWCGNDFDFMEHLTAAPVPPHGDLIDAFAFRREMDTKYPFDKFTQSKHGEADAAKSTILMMLAKAPTIIEAEE